MGPAGVPWANARGAARTTTDAPIKDHDDRSLNAGKLNERKSSCVRTFFENLLRRSQKRFDAADRLICCSIPGPEQFHKVGCFHLVRSGNSKPEGQPKPERCGRYRPSFTPDGTARLQRRTRGFKQSLDLEWNPTPFACPPVSCGLPLASEAFLGGAQPIDRRGAGALGNQVLQPIHS
jgi:hypothetical protein